MEFKGTKGEWSYELDHDKEYDQPTCKINSSYGIEGLATVWSGSDKMTDECIADSKLIAAAPELLETLQDLVRFCEDNQVGAELELSKAAIDKALN